MGKGTATIRTLADLARLAGVSTGTVSRALSNNAVVSPLTGNRIRALAAAHAFHPNQMASRLRRGCTGVVGVVVPPGHEHSQRLSDPFFMALLGHLADELTAHGYEVMLSRVIPDSNDWLDRIIGSSMLDGVLLVGQSDQFDTIERVAAQYRPLVAWGVNAGQASTIAPSAWTIVWAADWQEGRSSGASGVILPFWASAARRSWPRATPGFVMLQHRPDLPGLFSSTPISPRRQCPTRSPHTSTV